MGATGATDGLMSAYLSNLLEVKGGIKLNEYKKLKEFKVSFKANKKIAATIRLTGQTRARAAEKRMRQPDETIATLAPQQIFK